MRWMWIDRIVDCEVGVRMSAVKCVSCAEEHLHDHFDDEDGQPADPVMPAPLIIEGMAQTAGILVGATGGFREKVILAKVVRVELDDDVRPGQVLRYDATIDRMDAAGAATSGAVLRLEPGTPDASQWETIGRIDLMFSHIDRNMSGLEFPEENFVFSENFRTILRAAGLEGLEAADGKRTGA